MSNNHKATNKHAITGKQHFSFANICVPVINSHKFFIPILFGAVEKFFQGGEKLLDRAKKATAFVGFLRKFHTQFVLYSGFISEEINGIFGSIKSFV